MLRDYYILSKPGIVYANVITAVAGYCMASKLHFKWMTLISLTIGLGLIIAGACAFNNFLDQGIDARMKRTKKRGLVTGALTNRQALSYATFVTVAGVAILGVTQNILTTVLAVIALFDYVVLYGIGKRRTVHGTLVGCISGAIPLVAGYTAVTNRLDGGAWLLFVLMVAWQMAHFYGIALYRLGDYKAAKIPVMPAVYGERSTKLQALGYIVAFIISCLLLGLLGYIGWLATIVLLALGVVWLVRSLNSYAKLAADIWGKQVFLFSLIVMLVMSVALAVGPRLA